MITGVPTFAAKNADNLTIPSEKWAINRTDDGKADHQGRGRERQRQPTSRTSNTSTLSITNFKAYALINNVAPRRRVRAKVDLSIQASKPPPGTAQAQAQKEKLRSELSPTSSRTASEKMRSCAKDANSLIPAGLFSPAKFEVSGLLSLAGVAPRVTFLLCRPSDIATWLQHAALLRALPSPAARLENRRLSDDRHDNETHVRAGETGAASGVPSTQTASWSMSAPPRGAMGPQVQSRPSGTCHPAGGLARGAGGRGRRKPLSDPFISILRSAISQFPCRCTRRSM